MVILSGLLLIAAPAQDSGTEITVRAKRTAEALAACIASRCPTPDDARISIAHAEAQFAEGRYHDARRTLAAAIKRQKGNAAQYPRVVSALYEASATVNLHMGDMDAYRSATIGQTRTLRSHLPADDPMAQIAAMQLGDYWLKLKKPDVARAQYDAAADDYRAQGEHRLAALTELRAASVDIQMRSFGKAEKRIERAAGSPAANDGAVRLVSAVVQSRLARARGDEGAVDALLATLRTDPQEPPVLVRDVPVAPLYSPRTRRAMQMLMPGIEIPTRAYASPQILWADIGFMVAPDGSVTDVEVLRGSRARGWLKPFLTAAGMRRYAPLDLPAGSPGVYRVERFTWRPELIRPIGSLVRQPAGEPGIEILDITRDAAPPPPAEGAASETGSVVA
jgi:tetratricopeptide (TPR) repeat protein